MKKSFVRLRAKKYKDLYSVLAFEMRCSDLDIFNYATRGFTILHGYKPAYRRRLNSQLAAKKTWDSLLHTDLLLPDAWSMNVK